MTARRDESMERALIRLMLTELVGDFTKGAHVAIKNERERTGYCSHKRCAPICKRRWQLVEMAGAYLEARTEREPERLEQLPFAATTTGEG
jgi:hypothetical protein